ncbi:MAG: ImmA/IrrE family metallo-endopeptidase [Nitrospirae bacterium]|nr:ImmA/IrrE family metallo-endopeptidase [Nitrospirota bacterium]
MVTQPTDSATIPRDSIFDNDAEAVDRLFRKALELKPNADAGFRDFLAFTKRLQRFSAYNAMLIHAQRPGARLVASRYQWAKVGRTVSPDAIPIIILWPFGPVLFVYEESDTSGKPLPFELEDPFSAYGMVKPTSLARTVKAAGKLCVRVESCDYGSNLAGTAARMAQSEAVSGEKDVRWRVRINKNLDEPSSLATLAHELAHIYCGHLGEGPKFAWPDRSQDNLSAAAKELEAEAAAHIVCLRAGLETESANYLKAVITKEAVEQASVYAILTAANRIEARN